MLKQTRPAFQLPELYIKAFKSVHRISFVDTGRIFISTRDVPDNYKQFFFIFQKPHRPLQK
jgi:hypothetical protein